MYLEWLPTYSVEVEEIDEQHKKFVLLINNLADTIDIGCEEIALGDVITQLNAYADYHFATEEKYFDLFNYEHTLEHKKSHQGFRDQVNDFKNCYIGDEIKCAKEVQKFMNNWLIKHITEEDKEYVDCFKEHGLK